MSQILNTDYSQQEAVHMITTLVLTNGAFLLVVFVVFEFLHRIFPMIYHPQDIIHGEIRIDSAERDPQLSFRKWFRRSESTLGKRFLGFFREIWVVKVARTSIDQFVARSNVSIAPYLRWKRYIINSLVVFSLGSCIVLIPTNWSHGTQCRGVEGVKVPLWTRVSSSCLPPGSSYYWIHLSLLAVFAIYFMASYTTFLRRHVSLNQHLFQRPIMSSYTVMMRYIPPALRTREGIEAMVADVFDDVARVTPLPANVDKIQMVRGDMLSLRGKLRVARQVPEHWYGTRPRIEGKTSDNTPYSITVGPGVNYTQVFDVESPCSSQLPMSDVMESDSAPRGMPEFVSRAAQFADLQSPYARAEERRQNMLARGSRKAMLREARWQALSGDSPATTALNSRAKRNGRLKVSRWRAMYRGACTELQSLRSQFFLPSSPTASVAFVTFNSKAAAHAASMRLFYPDSRHPSVEPAPDPADVIWANVNRADRPPVMRVMYFIVTIFALFVFYLVPIALINTFLASSTWEDFATGSQLKWLNDIISFFTKKSLSSFISIYLPSLLLSALMGLLPVVIKLQCNAAGPLTNSQLNVWHSTIYFSFLVFNVFVQQLLANVVSEVIKLLLGQGSDVLSQLFTLNNATLAKALADNATFFAIYILQQYLLGSGLYVLCFGNVFSVAIEYLKHIVRYRKLRAAEKRQRRNGEVAPMPRFWPDHLRPGSGKIPPFQMSRILAADAFITGLCSLYCIFSPLLSPLVLVIFLVREVVDRYVLYHISPPLPIFQPSHDLILTSTKWLAGGFIVGACFDAIYFTTFGEYALGYVTLGVAFVVFCFIISINARYRRSLTIAACALPPQYRDEEAKRVVAAVYSDRGLVERPEETRTRTDYEFPFFTEEV